MVSPVCHLLQIVGPAPVTHTAHDVGKNLDFAGAVLCGSTLLRCGVGDHCCARSEGERHSHRIGPLGNDVGDAGATALADALQATVLTCGTQRSRNVHLVATDVALQGGVSSWRRRVVVQLVLLFFSCVSKENVAWRGVLFASCSKVDVALFQNRTGPIECLVIGICLVAVPHQSVSSGPWGACE